MAGDTVLTAGAPRDAAARPRSKPAGAGELFPADHSDDSPRPDPSQQRFGLSINAATYEGIARLTRYEWGSWAFIELRLYPAAAGMETKFIRGPVAKVVSIDPQDKTFYVDTVQVETLVSVGWDEWRRPDVDGFPDALLMPVWSTHKWTLEVLMKRWLLPRTAPPN
jgi:hypothetical protein